MQSHLADAPLRPRRHSDTYDNLKKRKFHDYDARPDREPLNDSTLPFSSSSSSSTRPLKVLLLPAQLEIRRLSKRTREASDSPKRFSTDSAFHLHQLLPRQSLPTSTRAQIDQALRGVDAETSCRAVVRSYEGPAPVGQLRRSCYQAVARAREAEAEAEASSTSRRAAAAATRTRQRPRATTTTSARLRTITLSSAPTGNIAAPITSLNPSQSLAAAVSSRFSAAESAVASVAVASSLSRASIQSSVESLFSEAASEVSSRRAAAIVSSTASSSIPSSSSASSSSSSSSSASPSSTSSSADPSATAAPARSGNNRNLARIIAPSVIVPIAVLLLLLLGFCLWRRKRRRNGAGAHPSISNPQPLRAAPRQYAAGGTGAGAGALAGAGAVGAAAAAGRGAGESQESFGTTPSAIGVAFSEPRTRWGRRSLVDVLAGGVRASSPSDAPSPSPIPAASFSGTHSRSPTFGHAGKQPSISSVASEYRGVGGYNSHTGYQPGQMRPVVSPLAHYDPFGPGSIVAVPSSAQRHVSSSDSSQSGYGDEGNSAGSRSTTAESLTAQFAPPLAGGYAHAPVAQQSRTTQTSGEGYYTANAGFTSSDSFAGEDDDPAEMLSDEGYRGSPGEEQAVNFGSGSSGSGSRSGSQEDPQATPRVGSAPSTPRSGAGHGSGIGVRRNDGTGSWWN